MFELQERMNLRSTRVTAAVLRRLTSSTRRYWLRSINSLSGTSQVAAHLII